MSYTRLEHIDAHNDGDCWPSMCPICAVEDTAEPLSGTYGQCTSCGAVEANLVSVRGHKDLSAMGESPRYPHGYGCEYCA